MARVEAPVSPPGEAAEGSRRSFAALRHAPYRVYLVASWMAMTGDNMEHVITYFAMYQAFHSPALAGYAVVSHWLPVLLFGLYAGALADRFDCRRLIQTSTAITVTAQLSWAALLLSGRLEMWHAVVLLTLHGAAALFNGPATQLIMHDMVGREDLQSAVRLAATSRQIGILVGPAVGGGLMMAFGPGIALIFNAMMQLPLAVWLLFTPYTGHLREEARERRSLSPRDVLQTARQLSSSRSIVAMLGVAGLVAVLVGNAFQAQMPEFAEDLGDEDGGHGYTALQMAQAGGAIVGGFGLEATGLLKPNASIGILCATLFGIAVIAFAAAPSLEMAVAILFAIGLLRLAFSTMAQTIVQLEAPPAIRGRALGLLSTAQMGLQVGAGLTVGVLGQAIGIHLSLGISAFVVVIGSLALLAWYKGASIRTAKLATS